MYVSAVDVWQFASCVVCWLPLYIVCVVDPAYTHLPTAVHRAVIDLFLLKSALHPLLYLTGLRSLRHEVRVCRMACNRWCAICQHTYWRTRFHLLGVSEFILYSYIVRPCVHVQCVFHLHFPKWNNISVHLCVRVRVCDRVCAFVRACDID